MDYIKEGDIYIYKGPHSHFWCEKGEYYKVDKEYIISEVRKNESADLLFVAIKGDTYSAWKTEQFKEYFKKKIDKNEVKTKPHFVDLSINKEYVLWDNQCLPHGNFVSNASYLGTMQTLSRYKHIFKLKNRNIEIVDEYGHSEYGNEFTIWDKNDLEPKKWYVNLWWDTKNNKPHLGDIVNFSQPEADGSQFKFIKTIELTNE